MNNVERNELYPIFLKASDLNILIVRGGNVSFEKLFFLLKSSKNAQAQIVSKMFRGETIILAKKFYVKMITNSYNSSFLDGKHIVISTTDNITVNKKIS